MHPRPLFTFALFPAFAVVAFAGNAQVPSLIPGISEDHCSQITGAVNSDILVCQVWDKSSELFSSPRQLEIYRKGRLLRAIEPEAPIREWHLWRGDRQLAVHLSSPGKYALYDLATGNVVGKCPERAVSTDLPEWAKSQSEREDEGVPEGPAYTQQRAQWIAKLLRKLQTLHAGIERKDIQALLKEEGGISTRFEQTYVSIECPFIKMDIHFKAMDSDSRSNEKKPDDVIESISKPYLDWSYFD